jgi:hypothetical protein
MQRVTLVRYATKPGRADENEKLARAVYDDLRARRPEGISYSLFRNGSEFVHLFVNTREADSEILTEMPSFKAYLKDFADRYAAPPEVTRTDARLVEAYGLDAAMAEA